MSRHIFAPHHQRIVIPESVTYHQHPYQNNLVAASSNCCHSDDGDSFISESASYQHHQQCCQHVTDRSYSDSSRHDDHESLRRLSRNSSKRPRQHNRRSPVAAVAPVHGAGGDVRRVYPKQYYQQEIPIMDNGGVPRPTTISRRPPQSSRPQSSMSSSMTTSAIIDGCGGKCQTFENVCYFFLQLVFIMGILIGISLCIAGLVLRKSAARNLQVLVYIGALLIFVCALLLGIQLNARNAAKRRKMALRNAKRAPIPLERLHARQAATPLVALHNGVRVSQQVVQNHQEQPGRQATGWWRVERP